MNASRKDEIRHDAVLDGEIVCVDGEGRPPFNDLPFRRGSPAFFADRRIRQTPRVRLTNRRRRGWTREGTWVCAFDQKPKHEQQFSKLQRRHPPGDDVIVLWQV
jgi:hypothetical protein